MMKKANRKKRWTGVVLLLYGVLVALWAHSEAIELASRAECCGLYGDYGLLHFPFPMVFSSELSHWGGGPTRLNPWGILLNLALPLGLVFILNHPLRIIQTAACRIRMGLSRQNRRVIRGWKKAGADLNITIKPCYCFQPDGGKPRCALVWIRDFGSPKGTLVTLIGDDNGQFFETAGAAGFYASALNPASYTLYHRETFMATLLDWGWCGEKDQAPDWMKGRDNPWAL